MQITATTTIYNDNNQNYTIQLIGDSLSHSLLGEENVALSWVKNHVVANALFTLRLGKK